MSESGAGETKVDGKAHEEGDEICRSPGKRAENAGGGEVGQQRRGVFRKGCGIVAQSLELLLLGGLQRSEGAGVSVADGTEERVTRGRWCHGRDAPAGQGAVPRTLPCWPRDSLSSLPR